MRIRPTTLSFASIQRTAFRGETARNEFVSEVLDVDGRHVLVEHIPAQVCTRCGEAAFSRETTERIRLLVRGAHRPADSQFAPLHNPQSLVRDYVAGFTDERFKARYLKLAAALDRLYAPAPLLPPIEALLKQRWRPPPTLTAPRAPRPTGCGCVVRTAHLFRVEPIVPCEYCRTSAITMPHYFFATGEWRLMLRPSQIG